MSKAMKFQVLADKTNAAPNLKPTGANINKKAPVLASLQNREPTLVRGLSARESALKSLKLQDVKPRVVTRFTKPATNAAELKKQTISERQPLHNKDNGQTKAKSKQQEQENLAAISVVPKAKFITKVNIAKPTTTTTTAAKVLNVKQSTTTTTITSNAATASTTAVIVKPTTTKSVTTTTTAVAKAITAIENKQLIKPANKKQQQQKIEQIVAKTITTTTTTSAASAATHSTKLLANIENIDENDEKNPILVTEYVNDIYEYLYHLELHQLIRQNHLDTQTDISPRMRAVLINWINEVHEQFHLAVETYHMTVAIVDRYLQLVNNTKRSDFQLVGVTALFIAAKYEELFPPSVADLSYITDDSCHNKEILMMELQMLKVLDCDLSRPLPIHFLRRFSKAAKAEQCHHTAAKYFLELVSIDYEMAHYRPSKVAAGSLLLALHLFNEDSNAPLEFNSDLWTPTLTHYSTYAGKDLKNIVKKIAVLVENAPLAKLDAVYRKYASPKYQKISKCAEMSGAILAALTAKQANNH